MAATAVPKGKVACLLCRGFVGYKSSDRTRFKAHMEEEHEVRYDSDLVLAVSVLNREDREAIVRAVMPRLEQIGRGEVPGRGALLPGRAPAPSSAKTSPPPAPSVQPVKTEDGESDGEDEEVEKSEAKVQQVPAPKPPLRGGPARGRGRGGRGAVVRRAPAPRVVEPPRALTGNSSISVSLVDQSAKCATCGDIFPTKDAMSEHVRQQHLAKFGGLSIAAPREVAREREVRGERREVQGEMREVQGERREVQVGRREVQGERSTEAQVKSPVVGRVARSHSSLPLGLQLSSRSSPVPSSPLPPPLSSPLPPPPSSPALEGMSKCTTCGKLVRAQLLAKHQRWHLQAPRQARAVDIVDLDAEMEAIPTRTINDPPQLMETEALMVEEDKIKNEVESMETLELLDNLVNFLND